MSEKEITLWVENEQVLERLKSDVFFFLGFLEQAGGETAAFKNSLPGSGGGKPNVSFFASPAEDGGYFVRIVNNAVRTGAAQKQKKKKSGFSIPDKVTCKKCKISFAVMQNKGICPTCGYGYIRYYDFNISLSKTFLITSVVSLFLCIFFVFGFSSIVLTILGLIIGTYGVISLVSSIFLAIDTKKKRKQTIERNAGIIAEKKVEGN